MSPRQALSLPVLSAQQFERTAETITQTLDAQSLLQQGIELYEAERFIEAATVWQQANSAFESQGDNLGQALVLSNLSGGLKDEFEAKGAPYISRRKLQKSTHKTMGTLSDLKCFY